MAIHTLKEQRAAYKAQGKFHTPEALAHELARHIPNPDQLRDVYDPTCGAGMLLSVFPDHVAKYGQDIDAAALDDAAAIPGMHTHHGDVLTDPAWLDKRFHAIVANPPFSIPWTPTVDERFHKAPTIPTKGRADFAFLLHTLHLLADDGTAVMLMFPGICYRGGREQTLREYVTRNNWLDHVLAIPGDQFPDTSIATVILVLRKDRAPDTPVRFTNTETGTTGTATVEDMREQDWSWSVNTYAPEPVPDAPEIDPVELQETANRALLNNLRVGLEAARLVCLLEGGDISALKAAARRVIDSVPSKPDPFPAFDMALEQPHPARVVSPPPQEPANQTLF
ncbi:N-6 DNA methylase [Dermabacteraceae bacterium P13088]